MFDWLYWTLTLAWWLAGAPLMCFGMLYLGYWLAEKKPNRKTKKAKKQKERN